MTGFRQADVVLIPFPFTDFSTFKRRPALVISSDRFNGAHQDVIVAAITSHIPSKLSLSDFRLSAGDFRNAGLPKPSIVKLGKIVTIDKRLVHRKLGGLSGNTMSLILQKLHDTFGG